MDDEFLSTLPNNVRTVLTKFIEQAQSAFGNDLRSIVIYGSGVFQFTLPIGNEGVA